MGEGNSRQKKRTYWWVYLIIALVVMVGIIAAHPSDEELTGYSDIIVTVITAIIVALVSITVTIFVFLKSALDRMIDDNRYISRVANKHKSQSVTELFHLCVLGFATLAVSLLFHWLVTFVPVLTLPCVQISLTRVWVLAALTVQATLLARNLEVSIRFWFSCIQLENALQTIILEERQVLKEKLTSQSFLPPERDRLRLIGNWNEWETEGMAEEVIIQRGQTLCKDMSEDQFINLFLRAQILLLSGERGFDQDDIKESDIITVLQERDNILNPNINVGSQDLKDRRYWGEPSDGRAVSDYMAGFEQDVGYQRMKGLGRDTFFRDTQTLYEILEQYRDLLVSQKFTAETDPKKTPVRERDEAADRYIFAQGLYYFFLRILAVFVSALHIKDFSFNGSTLMFANFYSSILEDVSLYSALFYHTIFARTQLTRTVMDVSRFDSIDFYNTRFTASTLNNAELVKVRFEGAQLEGTGLSSCTFENCQIKDSDFEDCVLSGSQFSGCEIKNTDFLHCKMRGIQWEQNTVIESCNFVKSDIQAWSWSGGKASLKDCDFSQCDWRGLDIRHGELTGCDFSSAELIDGKFLDTCLESALFEKTMLAGGSFRSCEMEQTSMKEASLFHAEFYRTNLTMSDLTKAAAVSAHFKECNLSNSDCSEADFSQGVFHRTKFIAARLYDCSFTKAEFIHCDFDHILANHLQFTFALCTDTTFRGGFLSDSNLTKSEFKNCDFQGSDLTQLNATKVKFIDCTLKHLDFSETRFVDAEFHAAFELNGVVEGCIFSGCRFENVLFEKITFRNCMFANTLFIHCTVCEDGKKERPLERADLEQGCTKPEEQLKDCVFLG